MIPPMIPVISPFSAGTPEAIAIPMHKGIATRKTTIDAVRSRPSSGIDGTETPGRVIVASGAGTTLVITRPAMTIAPRSLGCVRLRSPRQISWW